MKAYEPLRSTRRPAAPFNHLTGSIPCFPLCRSGISRARSSTAVTPQVTRLTSSIFHSGHTEAYEPLRSTATRRAPFNHLTALDLPQASIAQVCISRARSFDLAVTPSGADPTTSSISTIHTGHMSLRSTRRPTAHLQPPYRAGIGPQASIVQVWHFPGQKLRLGGDALGADPTYLLYLPFRSHGHMSPSIDPPPRPRTLQHLTALRTVSPQALLCRSGISGPVDLAVTPQAPTRLTSSSSPFRSVGVYEPFDRPAAPPAHPSTTSPRRSTAVSLCRPGISPGQKLTWRYSGADPTHLPIFHSGPHEGIEPLRSTPAPPAQSFKPPHCASGSTHKPLLCRSWHFPGQKLRLGGEAPGR